MSAVVSGLNSLRSLVLTDAVDNGSESLEKKNSPTFLPIYVINLETSPERREAMAKRLAEIGLNSEIVSAVAGSELTEGELRQFVHYESMKLGKNEFGCLLSHVKCWEKLLSTDQVAAIVGEDDIYFSENFLNCLEHLRVPLNEVSIVRLETMLATATAVGKAVQREKSFSVLRLLTDHAGAGCYVINRVTAKVLTNSWKNMRHPIDIELFSPHRRSISPITIYQVVPAPCIQHNMLFPKRQIASDIGLDREDAKLGILPDMGRKSRQHFRNLFRPLYRSMYSLILRFSGKRRIKITFG